MTVSFNLIDRDWLPVIDQQGLPALLSLRDLLLQAHTLRAIHGATPLETAALLRLVLAVLYRVVDLPDDEDAWAERWQDGAGQFAAGEVEAYLRQPAIYRQFELLGPGPRFFQYPPDPKAKRKSINSLILHYASGNNGTLFDHHRDDEPQPLTPAEAARGLLVAQAFGVGGLSGLDEKFTDGPCAKGIVFVVEGANLFQTLMLNLVPQSRLAHADDRPVWEQQDPFADGRTMPYGTLDILTWPNRRIWFEEDTTGPEIRITSMRWSPGLRLAEDYRTEPMKLYWVSEEYGLRPLVWSSHRALWRNSATIFRLAPLADHAAGHGPLATRMLGSLYEAGLIERSRRYRLLAFGMLKDQASIEFFQAEELPLRIEYLLETCVLDMLKLGLELAEGAHTTLTRAVTALARGVLKPSLTTADLAAKPSKSKEDPARAQALVQSWNVARLYWGRLEGPFGVFVDRLPDDRDAALAQWREELETAARRTFAHAEQLARVDERSYRAIAFADSLFQRSLKKRLSENVASESRRSDE